MSSTTLAARLPAPTTLLWRDALFARLARLGHGSLTFDEAGQSRRFGEAEPGGLEARLSVRSSDFYRRLALAGTLGAAEAYLDGQWTTDDLTALIRVVLRNERLLAQLESGPARLGALAARFWSAFRPNTRDGSRKNIAHHYDLGNDFFERLLDPTLCYSSGVFPSDDASLEAASLRKLELICEKLELSSGERLVEIGTGWGALALHAARRHGARVVTTTLSQQQRALALARVRDAELERQVEVLDRDYRDLEGSFDKLVSVEMIEAIGTRQYPVFFERCAGLLQPGGRMLLQSITICERAYARHRREIDFIKRYIFPGSDIPSTSTLVEHGARAGLELQSAEDYGVHYARTLAAWRTNLEASADWVRARHGERFYRMWTFYLCYCEAGFREGYLGVQQIVFDKPRWA